MNGPSSKWYVPFASIGEKKQLEKIASLMAHHESAIEVKCSKETLYVFGVSTGPGTSTGCILVGVFCR